MNYKRNYSNNVLAVIPWGVFVRDCFQKTNPTLEVVLSDHDSDKKLVDRFDKIFHGKIQMVLESLNSSSIASASCSPVPADHSFTEFEPATGQV